MEEEIKFVNLTGVLCELFFFCKQYELKMRVVKNVLWMWY